MYTSMAQAGGFEPLRSLSALDHTGLERTRLFLSRAVALKAWQAQRCVSQRKARCKMPMAMSCTARR